MESIRKLELEQIHDDKPLRLEEVSSLLGIKPHVLRVWESEHPELRHLRARNNGVRMYRARDVALFLEIQSKLLGTPLSHPREGGDPGAVATQSDVTNLLDSRLRGNDGIGLRANEGEPLIAAHPLPQQECVDEFSASAPMQELEEESVPMDIGFVDIADVEPEFAQIEALEESNEHAETLDALRAAKQRLEGVLSIVNAVGGEASF